jgi:N6-L-threonylcarbamoyladenine synthase
MAPKLTDNPAPGTGTILGIESSCDETAAAVVRAGEELLSNVVFSQIATHQPYGGVVPELASREHLRGIVPVVRQALAQAGKSYADLDAIAVTQGPGLTGALLVGVSYAKALAFALGKPLIAVNHLEGHIHAVLLEEKQKGNRELRFPVLALVVSGGHTHLYLCTPARQTSAASSNQASRHAGADDGAEAGAAWRYELIGRTRDDAAGEAYDKVAKLLGLGYPGGPAIDLLARHGDAHAVKFGSAQIKAPLRGGKQGAATAHDFSFSGIKTAVLRYVELNQMQPAIEARRAALAGKLKPTLAEYLAVTEKRTLDLVASFQRAVVEDLVAKTLEAAQEREVATLFVTGGVAANSELRETFEKRGAQAGVPVHFPSRPLATDNAGMIAAAAYPKFVAGAFAPLDFSAEASLALR